MIRRGKSNKLKPAFLEQDGTIRLDVSNVKQIGTMQMVSATNVLQITTDYCASSVIVQSSASLIISECLVRILFF
jgi:hypothetical protein